MPNAEKVLGFSNKWYAPGFKQAIDFIIDNQHTVKIFTAAYFIASKLEAFKSRVTKMAEAVLILRILFLC